MKADHHSPGGDSGRFRTTRWTAVLLSAQSQVAGSSEALEKLCQVYWYPIYAFVRHQGHNPDDARDLTQGFFLHLFKHEALTRVDPLKGKFRSFLIASLQNYLLDQVDSAQRLKRGRNLEIVPLDAESAENHYDLGTLDFLTAETLFDARWAMTLLDEVLRQLREEYTSQGKTSIFEALKPFLDPISGQVQLSYEQVAGALQVSVGSVKTLIHRLRKRYAVLLREEVLRTVYDPSDVDEEIHSLCEALIATEGRLGP